VQVSRRAEPARGADHHDWQQEEEVTGPQVSPRDRDIVTAAGLVVVGAAAAVLSFSALADLARVVGVTGVIQVGGWSLHLAWLFPLAVDVFAFVATRVWLRGRAAPDVIASARESAWGAIVTTVAGNAYHGYLTGQGRIDAVVVGAVPAVALGRLVHLAVLRGRGPGESAVARTRRPWFGVRAARWVKAWWAARKVRAQMQRAGRAAAVGTSRPTVPTGADSNEVLAADLRRLNADRQANNKEPLKRDAVGARYRIGSTRAQTVRELAEESAAPTGRPHLVPKPEDKAV
jgi:hypothetical protein